MSVISIADMARVGCTTERGIRYWEDESLLGLVERTAGGQRRYTEDHLDRARIIAACQFGAWSLEDAKKMILGYDREAYDALVNRFMSQATLAEQLAVALPQPKDSAAIKSVEPAGANSTALEWDL